MSDRRFAMTEEEQEIFDKTVKSWKALWIQEGKDINNFIESVSYAYMLQRISSIRNYEILGEFVKEVIIK